MERILQVFKFGIVGFIGMAVDFSITWLFKEIFKVNKYLANAGGFIFAVTNNYIINRIWTFKSTHANWEEEFLKFLIVSLVGLGLNTLIIYLVHQRKEGINFYIAKLIAIIIVFIWNYTINALFTFS